MESVVIYTAIAGGGRDVLEDPIPVPGVRYVCFTDQPVQSKIWEIRPFEFITGSNVITAKHPKVLPHKYFADYDVSIWVDGNIRPNINIVSEAAKVLRHNNIAAHTHPRRGCAYQEITHLLDIRSDLTGPLVAQAKRYKVAGLADYFGLWECGVLFRRHNGQDVIDAMKVWWDEIINSGHARDQMGFAYTMWKTGFKLFSIPGNLRKKSYLQYKSHDLRHSNKRRKRWVVWRTPNSVFSLAK